MSEPPQETYFRARLPSGLEVPVRAPKGFYDPDAAFPHFYSVGGWQRSDDDHPTDGGVPGYRVAYKTVKLFVVPDFTAEFPNLLLRVGQGSVERGGMRVRSDALPGRLWNQRIIPEFGEVRISGGKTVYDGTTDFHFRV